MRRHLIVPEIQNPLVPVFLPPRLHRQRHPLSRLHRACGKRKGRCNLIQLPNDRQRYLTAAGNSAAPPVAVQRERRQSAVIIAGGHVPRQLSRLAEAEYADARSVRPHRHRVLAVIGNGAGDVSLDHPIAQGRPLPRCALHGEGGILCAGDQRLVSRKRGRSIDHRTLCSQEAPPFSVSFGTFFAPILNANTCSVSPNAKNTEKTHRLSIYFFSPLCYAGNDCFQNLSPRFGAFHSYQGV